MTVPVSIMWFRQDLRVKDNPALNAACDKGKIIPVYILDEAGNAKSEDSTEASEVRELGEASQWWLHHSLTSLNKRLNDHLLVFSGDPKQILAELVEKSGATAVYWNRCYEPSVIDRDKEIKKTFIDDGIEAHSSNGSLLWEPMAVKKKDGTPYRVFTPYYRKGCLNVTPPRYPQAPPARITYADELDAVVSGIAQHKTIEELNLLPALDWADGFSEHWTPGEEGAADKLQDFIEHSARKYKDARDIPSMNATSHLSPHLHLGEVSPNQVWYAIKNKFESSEDKSIDTYLSELGWREFSYYLLFHFPTIPKKNFNDKFDKFNWRTDAKALKAWQTGQTGIPIVDAGMRELWQTGYMHNRVRMIVGSFLVKNLLISWQEGERWFWDCLVDADLASNTASWQWVAGTGADAAPYFRIFNPLLQGEKFDKQGKYVRKYCPELADLPDKYIHKPWDAPSVIAKDSGVELGKTYPKPIVDLKASRQRALDAFQALKE
ncbi:deoxyribodipyrimidine photo-lyase [Alteromonas sp. 1_MG-2023]|uniref:cryptochrome/photolyase family protein n=1 Tax=Alteromonas sp. 1_MG-2023 TaxID=3062669 RepID=UPI0026E2577B|nr:deoxyribodipyrimidine photo-lyase [Alteromonas sp. 1_MG-2023]MDO6565869.1 deoxyribodipyrimidine photo-lyase [Alteromonas sp. 1_MG-2023]